MAYVMSDFFRFIISLYEKAHPEWLLSQGDPLPAHVASSLYRHDGQIVFCRTQEDYSDILSPFIGVNMSLHMYIHI